MWVALRRDDSGKRNIMGSTEAYPGIFSLAGKTGIVTGGSRGIGKALVGATVWLASGAGSFTTGKILTIDGGLTLR